MTELAVDFGLELPASWTIAAIQEVAEISPKLDVSNLGDDHLVHFVPMAAVAENFGGLDPSQLRPMREVRKGYTAFSEGDVLFAKITPCMENGKGAIVPKLPHVHAFGSTEFHVLRPGVAIADKWLAYYLSQPDFRRIARQNMTGTAGQLRVPATWLSATGVPLPPRAEQARIVEKLEELLSDLDAGVGELKTALRKLAQYRQSLLRAAVEGVLTTDWRGNVPASGELPEGWEWTTIGALGKVQLGRQRSPEKLKGINPTKYIRAANITENGIDFDDVLEMDFSETERATFALKQNDVLLTEASGSAEHVGRQ